MRKTKWCMAVCMVVYGSLLLVQAQVREQSAGPGCVKVQGRIHESIIPAPNDPFGRVVGPVTGSLEGVATAIITNLSPTPTGLQATTEDIIVTEDGDKIFFDGSALFTPIPGLNPAEGHFTDNLTLTVGIQRKVGNDTVTFSGTGKFDQATGTLTVTGEGHFLFLNPLQGNGFFQLRYSGTICGVTR